MNTNIFHQAGALYVGIKLIVNVIIIVSIAVITEPNNCRRLQNNMLEEIPCGLILDSTSKRHNKELGYV